MTRVFVGMSGGVDSSTAAALLVEEGHEVVGVTLALLDEDASAGLDLESLSEGCCDSSGARRARAVCDELGIPHYTWNAREAFRAEVIGPFAAGYAAGETPNPCVTCNDRIKFGWLLDRAVAAGADMLATGHYARVVTAPETGAAGAWAAATAVAGPAAGGAERTGALRLARGADASRDQSYFLYRLGPERLARILFPLGDLRKDDVRALALELGLPTATAPESREACFAPDGDYARVVGDSCPEALEPGDIVALDGRVLGRHEGVARYTVGQRKGLSLPDGPWFVVRLEPEVRRVVVGREADLEVRDITARDPVWYGGTAPATPRSGLTVQLRYRSRPLPARVDLRRDPATGAFGTLRIQLTEPVTGVAPGQAAVVYEGESVLAGGVVSEAG